MKNIIKIILSLSLFLSVSFADSILRTSTFKLVSEKYDRVGGLSIFSLGDDWNYLLIQAGNATTSGYSAGQNWLINGNTIGAVPFTLGTLTQPLPIKDLGLRIGFRVESSGKTYGNGANLTAILPDTAVNTHRFNISDYNEINKTITDTTNGTVGVTNNSTSLLITKAKGDNYELTLNDKYNGSFAFTLPEVDIPMALSFQIVNNSTRIQKDFEIEASKKVYSTNTSSWSDTAKYNVTTKSSFLSGYSMLNNSWKVELSAKIKAFDWSFYPVLSFVDNSTKAATFASIFGTNYVSYKTVVEGEKELFTAGAWDKLEFKSGEASTLYDWAMPTNTGYAAADYANDIAIMRNYGEAYIEKGESKFGSRVIGLSIDPRKKIGRFGIKPMLTYKLTLDKSGPTRDYEVKKDLTYTDLISNATPDTIIYKYSLSETGKYSEVNMGHYYKVGCKVEVLDIKPLRFFMGAYIAQNFAINRKTKSEGTYEEKYSVTSNATEVYHENTKITIPENSVNASLNTTTTTTITVPAFTSFSFNFFKKFPSQLILGAQYTRTYTTLKTKRIVPDGAKDAQKTTVVDTKVDAATTAVSVTTKTAISSTDVENDDAKYSQTTYGSAANQLQYRTGLIVDLTKNVSLQLVGAFETDLDWIANAASGSLKRWAQNASADAALVFHF
jgi:hypothetical protein